MEKLLRNMGFSPAEIDKLGPETEKFVACETELKRIRKDIAAIKISLILIVAMTAFSITS